MRSLVTMKINNLIVKIFLCIYLVIIIAGVVIFENIGFSGGGLEKMLTLSAILKPSPLLLKIQVQKLYLKQHLLQQLKKLLSHRM